MTHVALHSLRTQKNQTEEMHCGKTWIISARDLRESTRGLGSTLNPAGSQRVYVTSLLEARKQGTFLFIEKKDTLRNILITFTYTRYYAIFLIYTLEQINVEYYILAFMISG